MQHRRIILQLKTLTKEELILFEKFLISPYFSINKNCLRLFKIFSLYHNQDYDSPKLKEEKIFFRVFPQKVKYKESDANNMRTLISKLSSRLDHFFILQELENKEEQQQLLLADAYIRRKVPSETERSEKKIVQKKESPNPQFYLNRFLLFWKLYETEDFKDRKVEIFANCNKNLDLFFALSKLKIGIEHTNLSKRHPNIEPICLLEPVQHFISQSADTLNEVFPLYAELVDITYKKKISLKQFQAVCSNLENAIPFLKKQESLDITVTLFNYANAQFSLKGDQKGFIEQAFSILQLGFKNHLFLHNNVFHNSTFYNIVTLGASLSKFAEIEKFISKYSPLLPEDTKALDLATSKANFQFFKGKNTNSIPAFRKCIKTLSSIKSRDPKYNLRIRWNLLKVYYEIFIRAESSNNMDATEKHANSFYTHIWRSNAYNANVKKSILKSIIAIKKLTKARFEPDFSPKQAKKMIENIKSTKRFSSLWIEEMIEEFFRRKNIPYQI